MIVISANNNEEVLTLPIHPVNTPISIQNSHEVFSTFQNGDLILIDEHTGLRSVTIDSFLPEFAGKYGFQEKDSVDADDYLKFFDKWTNVPIRIYISDKKGNEKLNMPCVVSSFSHDKDRANDTVYSLVLNEFVLVGE